MSRAAKRSRVAVIGGGPAGLSAAEVLAAAGHEVDVFDAMPSPGRKFLLAGIGGLNLTHAEDAGAFVTRYGESAQYLAPVLAAFGAEDLRSWAGALGIDTFVGSSGRVFPTEMKAAPLLRAWLHRLREEGVRIHVRHRWTGWFEQDRTATAGLRFATPEGEKRIGAEAVVLALGGGSWARLGSDGAWLPWLAERGVQLTALRPANCGFEVGGEQLPEGWSAHLRERFAGQPLKSIAIEFVDHLGKTHRRNGECIVTAHGLEGSLIYALSAPIRDTIEARGSLTLSIDLAPGRTLERLTSDLSRPRGSRSLSSHLQGQASIAGLKTGLLRECAAVSLSGNAAALAAAIKSLPVTLVRPRPIDEAISTAGGVRFEALSTDLMLRELPGVFCCGEMLDWEAPTGGYLLTACFATGRAAGLSAAKWLGSQPRKAMKVL